MEAGVEALGACTLPNRSLTGWLGPEIDEFGGLAEKAFQSPNSAFPLDEAAAVHKGAGDMVRSDFTVPALVFQESARNCKTFLFFFLKA